jgi:hypothetical protein
MLTILGVLARGIEAEPPASRREATAAGDGADSPTRGGEAADAARPTSNVYQCKCLTASRRLKAAKLSWFCSTNSRTQSGLTRAYWRKAQPIAF